MKKILIGLTLFIVATVFMIDSFDPRWMPDRKLPYLLGDADSCPFCHKIPEELTIYKNGSVKVLLNHAPVVEGQLLITPKQHVERFEELTNEQYADMGKAVGIMKKALKKDYVLILQNGYDGGQTVNHTHIHMIPRGPESTLMKKIYLWKVFLTDAMKWRKKLTLEEQKKQIAEIQKELNEQ